MKLFLSLLLILFTIFASYMVMAAPTTERTVSLSWELPTTRTDGTLLEPSELYAFGVYADCGSGFELVETVLMPDTYYIGIHLLECQYWTATAIDFGRDLIGGINPDTLVNDDLESDYADPVFLKAPPGRLRLN